MQAQLACESSPDFAEGYMHRVTADETRRNGVALGVRRWQLPGPYPRHIRRREVGAPPLAPLDDELIENYQVRGVCELERRAGGHRGRVV